MRNSYRMDHHIRHWATQARSGGVLTDAVDKVEVAPPNPVLPFASGLSHAARAAEIQQWIADDCRWAAAGYARENARHRLLNSMLDDFKNELARLLPIVQADEAKTCGDEVRALTTELEKIEDELGTRRLQLNFAQSDCTALVTSRDRLEAQLTQAGRKVATEGEPGPQRSPNPFNPHTPARSAAAATYPDVFSSSRLPATQSRLWQGLLWSAIDSRQSWRRRRPRLRRPRL